MRYLVVLLLLACAACESVQHRQQREAAEQHAAAEAYRQQVFGQCRAYGFVEGTDQFRTCLMQVDMAYRQQTEAQRQMLLQEYARQQGIFRK